jgi:hypothetical protein
MIVDRQGRLIECKSATEYSIVEGTPILEYSTQLDKRLRIAEDGRIYDIQECKYVEFKVYVADSECKADLIVKNYRYVTTIGKNMYVLDEDNILYFKSSIGDGIGVTFDTDVLHVLVRGNWLILVKTDGTLITYQGYEYPSHKQIHEKVEGLIGVQDGFIITNTCIKYVKGYHEIEIESVPLLGDPSIPSNSYKLIGVTSITNVHYILVEEVEGKLKIRVDGSFKCGDKQYCIIKGELNNQILNFMHEDCPWVELTRMNYSSYLINKRGLVVEFDRDIVRCSNIPLEIFKQNENVKSSRKCN